MNKFGSAVILAGGKSTRMGFDKQQVLVGGVLMVHYIAKQLEKMFDEVIIVTNRPELYDRVNYRVVTDIIRDKGPLSGIHTGLTYAQSEFVYFIAGDMPVVNLRYIKYMRNHFKRREAFACVTEVDSYIEPFNAFYSKDSLELITYSLQMDHLKISRLIKEQEHYCIEEDVARIYSPGLAMFMNLNKIQKSVDYLQFLEPLSVAVSYTNHQ